MANKSYFLDGFSTLDLETDEATPTSTPVAGIQDVTIVPNFSIERLYTADSVVVEEQKRHEFSVDVQIGFSKWDNTLAEQWLGGGGGSSSTSLTDTSDTQKFAINTADFVSADGNTTLSINITGITFEEMPLVDAARGEYLQWDLQGTGTDIADASTS